MRPLALALLLLASPCSAKDLALHWTNPAFGGCVGVCADSDSTGRLLCIEPDSTRPLLDYAGVDLYGIRLKAMADTVYFGRHRGMVGAPDSVTLSISDSVTMGIVLVYSVNGTKRACCPNSYLFALPNTYVPPPPDSGRGLLGEYWRGSKNNSFSSLLATRVDSTVAFDWGTGSPMQGVPADSFCVRWSGMLTIPADGSWTLYVRSSDGCRLWIDGVPVIDQWIYSFAQTFQGTANEAASPHSIRLDYFEDVGDASCVLSWSGPGVAIRTTVPALALSH